MSKIMATPPEIILAGWYDWTKSAVRVVVPGYELERSINCRLSSNLKEIEAVLTERQLLFDLVGELLDAGLNRETKLVNTADFRPEFYRRANTRKEASEELMNLLPAFRRCQDQLARMLHRSSPYWDEVEKASASLASFVVLDVGRHAFCPIWITRMITWDEMEARVDRNCLM